MVRDSNDETNVLNNLLLTGTQNPRLRVAFASGSPANTKVSKSQRSQIVQLVGIIEPVSSFLF